MTEERIAVVRTSDRHAFKRCRRSWSWNSSLRRNLTVSDSPSYFWIGTGGHFAMEDYYGYNHYGHPVEAARAYATACHELKRRTGHGLPSDWQEQMTMLEGILEYYMMWKEFRDEYKTVWIDDEPQVEITCHIPLDIPPPPGFDRVVYQFTLDRLVEIQGEYWILDWKFYKTFSQSDLDFDQQMSAYIWAAQCVYEDKPIAGGILHEFVKKLAKPPRIMANGRISTADAQGTTHRLYRQALIDLYGDVEKAPPANVKCLNALALKETEDRDDFIRRTHTRRNIHHIQAEGTKIMMEAKDMCDPNLPLNPNPTRDCSWDCGFKDICIMVDRDDDWEYALNDITIQRTEDDTSWRQHLPHLGW